jgi:hypothetical protein
MSKQEDQWHLKNKSGDLFVMPVNKEFEDAFAAADLPPYVFMQPVDDLEDGHTLMMRILKHRCTSILIAYGVKPQEPPEALIKLGEEYDRLKNVLERWAWPKTSDTSHFSKNVEQWHQASYKPEGTVTSAIWDSFVMNIAVPGDRVNPKTTIKKRLPVFVSMEEKTQSPDPPILPRIKLTGAKSHHGPSETTWRELLLGEGADGEGSWKRSIECYSLKRDDARSSPMSHAYSR